MIVGASICEIKSIEGISIPSGNYISFTENSGVRLMMRVTDIMRINGIIEKHMPKGLTKEEYFDMLSKRETI